MVRPVFLTFFVREESGIYEMVRNKALSKFRYIRCAFLNSFRLAIFRQVSRQVTTSHHLRTRNTVLTKRNQPHAGKQSQFLLERSTMMKFTALAALFASASAFAPVQQSAPSSVALNAERSAALPFLNRPALVSR